MKGKRWESEDKSWGQWRLEILCKLTSSRSSRKVGGGVNKGEEARFNWALHLNYNFLRWVWVFLHGGGQRAINVFTPTFSEPLPR